MFFYFKLLNQILINVKLIKLLLLLIILIDIITILYITIYLHLCLLERKSI